ncbi:DUF721 domain-containing protein [bacterium]|nr:DUF721 domain-containing protein [bacterium]
MRYKDEKYKYPEKIGDILTKAMKGKGWNTTLSENQACVYWDEIVGKEIAKRTQALKVENGVVFVKVNSNIWKQELHYMKPIILEKIRNFLNNTLITDIKFF